MIRGLMVGITPVSVFSNTADKQYTAQDLIPRPHSSPKKWSLMTQDFITLLCASVEGNTGIPTHNGIVHLLRQHSSVGADSRVCLEEARPWEKISQMPITATALGNIMKGLPGRG